MTDQHPVYADIATHLTDAFVARGQGMGFTFSPFNKADLPLWRIDYIFYSPELTAVDVTVGDFAGSDHKPVIATLRVSQAP